MDVNRWRCLRLVAALAVGIAALSSAPAAQANDMDPVLARMWRFSPDPNNVGSYRLTTRDDLFDALALELAMAMAPNALHPAETLGWSGFFMGLEATLTVIDADATQWRCGIENYGDNSSGTAGGDGACDNWDVSDGALFVPAIHVRKGLPYSIELGFQIQYMSNSELVGIGGEIRWAPFEGFREGWMGYLPDFSVGLTGNYIMGTNELVLGMLGANFSLSYPFVISGQAVITPMFGYSLYIVGADHEQVYNSMHIEDPQAFRDLCESRVADPSNPDSCSPYLQFHEGMSRNFGQQIASLRFHRLHLGVRILWENLAITPQFAVTVPWAVGAANGTTVNEAGTTYTRTEVKSHFQFSLSIGSDF